MHSRLELQHGGWTRDNFLNASDKADELTGKRRMSWALSKHFLEAIIATTLGTAVGLSYAVLLEDGELALETTKVFLVTGGAATISYVAARILTYYFAIHEGRAEKVADYLGKRTERN